MINYSFTGRGNNCTQDEAREFLKTTDKPLLYTHGLRFRGPVTMDVPISKEEAIKHLDNDWCDVRERETKVHINTYSANDMW